MTATTQNSVVYRQMERNPRPGTERYRAQDAELAWPARAPGERCSAGHPSRPSPRAQDATTRDENGGRAQSYLGFYGIERRRPDAQRAPEQSVALEPFAPRDQRPA